MNPEDLFAGELKRMWLQGVQDGLSMAVQVCDDVRANLPAAGADDQFTTVLARGATDSVLQAVSAGLVKAREHVGGS